MANLQMTSSNGHKVHIGTKSCTRRLSGLEVVNERPDEWKFERFSLNGFAVFRVFRNTVELCKPKFKVGQIVSIREPHYRFGGWAFENDGMKNRMAWIFLHDKNVERVFYPDNIPHYYTIGHDRRDAIGWYLRPSMFQFEKDVRTHVRITGIGCSRLQSITEEQAKAEGVFREGMSNFCGWGHDGIGIYSTAVFAFEKLWDSINKKSGHGWDKNDWVFDYSWAVK